MTIRHLPRGLALVRVETPIGRIVWVSDRLSPAEERAARILACDRVRQGARAVVLSELELSAVLEGAA
jgi:hypothetical protein